MLPLAVKLYPDKLDAHLAKGGSSLYLVHGDEPYQLGRIGDRLRAHAKAAGFAEREVVVANEDADWARFRESADSLSLFAERRLIELRIPTGKPGRVGGETLKDYAADPPPDVLLVVTSARLDRSGTGSAWFKAIDKVGVTIAVQPLPAAQLPAWLGHRLRERGLLPSPAALDLVAERVEGNLLAASQEVERLALLHPAGELDVDQVLASVADSARYSLPDLVLAALQGQPARALRVLGGLREEAVAETLVLWALAQEIRAAARAAETIAAGGSSDAALKSAGVWQNRVGPLKLALERHPDPALWLGLLATTAEVDRQIKGQGEGDAWDTLAALVARLAGDSGAPAGAGGRIGPRGRGEADASGRSAARPPAAGSSAAGSSGPTTEGDGTSGGADGGASDDLPTLPTPPAAPPPLADVFLHRSDAVL